MASLDTILNRIIAIAGDVSGVDTASDEYPATMAGSLPFAFIEEGEATYEDMNSNQRRITREFITLLYVQEFNPENAAQEASARDAARVFITSYPKHFLERSRLQRNDSGCADVIRATVSADSGQQTASRDQRLYSAVYVRHSVTYEEFITEV